MLQKLVDRNEHPTLSSQPFNGFGGFTLIELMIVVAVIAIILTLAIPTYSNYSIRVKISEAISLTEAAKAAVESFCQDDRTITSLNNQLARFRQNKEASLRSGVLDDNFHHL